MFAAHSGPLRVNLHARARVVILFSHCFHVDQLVLVPHWETLAPEIGRNRDKNAGGVLQ